MNLKIREANINDIDNGLLEVFIEGFRFHQKGRPDIFDNLTDEELRNNYMTILYKVVFFCCVI